MGDISSNLIKSAMYNIVHYLNINVMDTSKQNGLSADEQQLADKMAAEAKSGAPGPSKEVTDAMDELPSDEEREKVVEAAIEETLGSDDE